MRDEKARMIGKRVVGMRGEEIKEELLAEVRVRKRRVFLYKVRVFLIFIILCFGLVIGVQLIRGMGKKVESPISREEKNKKEEKIGGDLMVEKAKKRERETMIQEMINEKGERKIVILPDNLSDNREEKKQKPIKFRQSLMMAGAGKRDKKRLEGKKLVALTFDDGPGAGTEEILRVLKEKKAFGSFFMLGSNVRNSPGLAKKVRDSGHEIGNHTMWHKNFNVISQAEAVEDVRGAERVFDEILEGWTEYMRSPYGIRKEGVFRETGMVNILWDIDTLDWKEREVESVRKRGVEGVEDGSVILMHDLYPTTAQALPLIIDELKGRGFEFATISELAERKKVKLEVGRSYFRF